MAKKGLYLHFTLTEGDKPATGMTWTEVGQFLDLLIAALETFVGVGQTFPVEFDAARASVVLHIPPQFADLCWHIQTGRATAWSWPQIRAFQRVFAYGEPRGWRVSLGSGKAVRAINPPASPMIPMDFATFERNYTDDQLGRLLSLSGPDRRAFLSPRPIPKHPRPIPERLSLPLPMKAVRERIRVYGDLA